MKTVTKPMEEDYYKVLGIKRDASQSDIQRAYRELARKYHPDMNPNDEKAKERFQRVQQAYDVLGTPDKREMYDRYGSSFQSAAGGPGGGGPGAGGPYSYHWGGPGGSGAGFQDVDFSQFFGGGGAEGFADMFRQFGGGRTQRRRRSQPGANLHHEIQVPFQTAIEGGEAAITIQRPGGKVETISVRIPAGIEDGKKVRVRGQGEPSPTGGKPGDILITVRVAPHPYFTRRGNDLEVTVPVTLAEAALGAKIDVPTPKGVIALTVPPGTSGGKRLRVKGHGVAPPAGKAGDLYALIRIALPPTLDETARQQIRDIDERHPSNPRADLRW